MSDQPILTGSLCSHGVWSALLSWETDQYQGHTGVKGASRLEYCIFLVVGETIIGVQKEATFLQGPHLEMADRRTPLCSRETLACRRGLAVDAGLRSVHVSQGLCIQPSP